MFSFLARLNTPTSSPTSTSRSSSPRNSVPNAGLNASFASDPTQWESTFDKCWKAVDRILETKAIDPEHIVPYEELSHLLAQLTQMNQLLMMEVNSQPEPVIGPILDKYFTQQIMERVLDWAIQIPDGTRSICQLGLIRIYETIVGESHTENHCLLVHKPILNPLLRLFNWCKRIEGPRPSSNGDPSVNDKHFVLLLNQICRKLSEDRTLLHFFYNSEQFFVFTLLVPFLYEQNDVGQLARDAVLLILNVTQKHDAIAEFIALKSAFCPVVATGLSGCFSQLPRVLAPEGSGIVPEHSTDALNNYNASLVFCNAVAQAANPLVVNKICSFFYSGFLISVVKPALLQEEREAAAASTVYLQLCLSALKEPSLIQTVIRMLFVERDDRGAGLLDVITERINGHDRLASASVQILDTLVNLICEDVMLLLILRNLLPLRFTRQHMAKIYDTSYTQTLAKKILECVPECMLNMQEICSQETLSVYIEEGADLVDKFAAGCSAWKWRYDGVKPNPSSFRTDSDDEINLTTLSRLSSCRSSMTSARGLNRYAASRASHLTAESTLGELVDLGGDTAPNFVDNYDEPLILEDDEFILPPVSMSTSMVDYFQLAAFDDLSEGDDVSGPEIQIAKPPPPKKASESGADSDTAMAKSFVLSGWAEIQDMDTFLSLLDSIPLTKNAENCSTEECVNYINSRLQYWQEFDLKEEKEEPKERKESAVSSGFLDSNMMFGLPIDPTTEPSLFLDTILSQLEIFYEHSLTYNLHFTSLLSALAAYPLPLLLVYLFESRKAEGKPNLLEILIKLKRKTDELTSNIDGLSMWIARSLKIFQTRADRAERGDGLRGHDLSFKEESSSPISSFIRNSRIGASGRKTTGIRYHIHKAVESAESIRDDERTKNVVHSAVILANLVQLLAGIVLQQPLAVVYQR